MKTEFESRISWQKIRQRSVKKPVWYATVYWNDKLYESIKYTKELCVIDLKLQANIKE